MSTSTTQTPPALGAVPWPPAALGIHVVGAKPGTRVELVPGKTYVSLDPANVETVAVTEMVPAGGGLWRAVVRICPRKFALTPQNLTKLGIAISSRGLRRLILAKFVKGETVTPGVHQFDYFDYMRHEAAVAADPEFWDRKEAGHKFTNRERYRQAL